MKLSKLIFIYFPLSFQSAIVVGKMFNYHLLISYTIINNLMIGNMTLSRSIKQRRISGCCRAPK
jgi:hypothetical protein